MLSNLSNGTRLYMKSPEGPQLEVITLTHGPQGPLFTVTPNTCRYPERKEINLPHLLGFYNKHVLPEGAPRYDGNPFAILFLLDGPIVAGKCLALVEDERLKAEETVPCVCCDADEDLDNWSYDDDEEDNGRTDPDAMNAFMAAVAAGSFNREEATKSVASLPPVSAEDTEEDKAGPHPYSQLLKRLRLLPRNLSVYVKLPGGPEWHGIFLRKGAFYDDGEPLNEWHLLGRYRKRFKVKEPSSTMPFQAIYVGGRVIGANESLASLLIERTDEGLAVVGSVVPAPQAPAPQAPQASEPDAIATALARIAAKEQALLAELAELDKVQAAMARVTALEARVAAARAALKDI
jgi:hypothetical protein